MCNASEITGVCTKTTITNFTEMRDIAMSTDVLTNVSTFVMLAVGADMLNGMAFMIEAVTGRTFELIVGVSYVVEVLTAECAVTIIGGAHGSDTKVNLSGLTAALAALEFALPASLNESFSCC